MEGKVIFHKPFLIKELVIYSVLSAKNKSITFCVGCKYDA